LITPRRHVGCEMSKITFRADDDLVRRLEEFDASKSEVMREALRAYLDGADGEAVDPEREADEEGVDAALADRIDELIDIRLDAALDARGVGSRADPQDVNVNISLGSDAGEPAVNAGSSGVNVDSGEASAASEPRKTPGGSSDEGVQTGEHACAQCGESVDDSHVYCPNCGEKATRRVFCDCGDELRTDWAFCPSCGRRTPAADVLDRP